MVNSSNAFPFSILLSPFFRTSSTFSGDQFATTPQEYNAFTLFTSSCFLSPSLLRLSLFIFA